MPRFSKDCLSGHRAVTQAAACSPKANLLWQAVLGHIDLWGGTLSAMRNIAACSAWEFTASMSHSCTHRRCTR